MTDKKFVSRLNKEQLQSARRKKKRDVPKMKQLWPEEKAPAEVWMTPYVNTCAQAIQCSPAAQACPTLCDPTDCSTPGLPVHHQLPEFTQTHNH